MRAHPDLSALVPIDRPLLQPDGWASRMLPADPRITLRQQLFGPMVEAEDAMKRLALSWPALQRKFEAQRPSLLGLSYDFVLRDGYFELQAGALPEADQQWLGMQLNQQAGLRFAASQFARAVARYYSYGDKAGTSGIAEALLNGGIRFRALLAELQAQALRERDRLRGSAAVNKLTTGRPFLYAARLARYGLTDIPSQS